MNRFVKQNLLLITVLSVSIVVIVALLVYSGIVYYQMRVCIAETENLQKRIRELISNSPAPVDGNKPLIQKDIDLYTKLNSTVSARIGNPYKNAGEVFIRVLKNVPKDKSVDEARRAFVEQYNNEVAKETNLAQQGLALEKLRQGYKDTWEKALKAFVAAIAPLTQEPDLDLYKEEFAFATIGIPRKMQNDFAQVNTYSKKYQEKIQQLLGQKISTDAEGMGFNYLENPNQTYGSDTGEANVPKNPFPPEDIPLVLRHWDIIGDICKRIATVNIKTLNFFHIRGISKENGSYAGTFERRGGYTISHYCFDVTTSLENIRALARAFNYDAKDKRLYAVRSIFVYASKLEEASAKQLLTPELVQQEMKNTAAAPQSRGRRRGEVAEEPQQQEATLSKEQQLQAKWREEFEKRERNLPFYQRIGYGDVKLGGAKEFRAVFDIEYIELAGQN